MTFLDLAEGGGEEMGKDCAFWADVDERSCAGLVRVGSAASRCAGFFTGERSTLSRTVGAGRSRRASLIATRLAGGLTTGSLRLSGVATGGAGFEAISSTLTVSAFASGLPAVTTGATVAVVESVAGSCGALLCVSTNGRVPIK